MRICLKSDYDISGTGAGDGDRPPDAVSGGNNMARHERLPLAPTKTRQLEGTRCRNVFNPPYEYCFLSTFPIASLFDWDQ